MSCWSPVRHESVIIPIDQTSCVSICFNIYWQWFTKKKIQFQFENLGFSNWKLGVSICCSLDNRFELVLLFKSNSETIIRITKKESHEGSFTKLVLRKKTSLWPFFLVSHFESLMFLVLLWLMLYLSEIRNFLVWLCHTGRLGDMIFF